MLAVISRTANGYEARYERRLKHSVEKVWAMLTENGKLAKWFRELRVEELRVGGKFKFDLGDGTFEEMEIFALEPLSILEYAWGEDRVRFELYPEEPSSCRLVLIESISKLTDHTPKDLAGWHVCLDVVEALLEGREYGERKPEWAKQLESYQSLVEEAAR